MHSEVCLMWVSTNLQSAPAGKTGQWHQRYSQRTHEIQRMTELYKTEDFVYQYIYQYNINKQNGKSKEMPLKTGIASHNNNVLWQPGTYIYSMLPNGNIYRIAGNFGLQYIEYPDFSIWNVLYMANCPKL